MKKFLKTQLKHELIGQAILELITQKRPITEQTLLAQLRSTKQNTTCQERSVVLQELITELLARAKKRAPSIRSDVTSKDEQERSDRELIALAQANKHKLH